MKKLLIILSVFLLVSCASSNESGETVTEDSIDIYQVNATFNDMLAEGNFEGLMTLDYNTDMANFLNKTSMETVFQQLEVGPVIKQYDFYETEQDGYTILTTPTEFEHKSFDLNLVFDYRGKIAGFNVVAFTGGEAVDVDVMAIAIRHHTAYAEMDLEALMTDFEYTQEMLNFVGDGLFEKDASSEKNGQLIEVKEAYTFDISGYTIVTIPVIYEEKSFNYDIAFDKQGLIAGLSFSDFNEKEAEADSSYLEEIPLNADVNGMSLPGILTLPKTGDKFPLVILVHGSGASDKDETMMQNKPFKDIAWSFAQYGIATYRYDKSVYAFPENFVDNVEMTLMDETVNDAVEILKILSSHEKVNQDQMYVLGHSLGGYAMPLIAQNTDAAGYIIMAGNVRPLDVLMEEQVSYILNLDGKITEEEQAYMDQFNAEIEKIRNLDEQADDTLIAGAYKAYWAFMNAYEPLVLAEEIGSKVLVLQGERDYQVTMEDYNLWYDTFSSNDNWSFKLYPSLNHLMMPGEGQPTNEEYATPNHVSETMIKDIADWINQ